MHTNRILMVVTSSDHVSKAPEPTGYWLEEVAGPYYTFTDARCEVTLASPQGGKAPCDPRSQHEENQTASTRRFAVDVKAQRALDCTIKLSTIDPADYDAVFFPGGHGTMEDFPGDPNVRKIVESFWRTGKPVGAVCHGQAAFVSAASSRGEPLIKGYRFTCFTNAEEGAIACNAHVPFLLETKLKELGGLASNAQPFSTNVIVDRLLVTGQNPASSIPTAEAVIHQLRQRMAA